MEPESRLQVGEWQEVEKGHALWPYRIEFSEVTHISPHDWEAKRVVPERKGIVFQRAIGLRFATASIKTRSSETGTSTPRASHGT